MASEWSNFSVALGIGLLIGLERERAKGAGPSRGPAGIRTFALASLMGAVAMHLGGVVLLAVVMGAGAVLIGLSYARTRETDPGLTTEIGLSIVPLLGALAMSDPVLAAGLAVTVAVVFAAKAPLHGLVKGALSDAEVRDGLVFAIATLVVWPLLPDRPLGPYGAINPHRVWLVVILVLAIGAAGHVALRVLGGRPALPLVGLAAGFVSSTAAIGSLAGRAALDPRDLNAAIAGSAFSTVSTFVQMAILLSSVSPETLQRLGPMLAAGGLVAAVYGLVFVLRNSGSGSSSSGEVSPTSGRAFSWKVALGLAALLACVSIATAALQAQLGPAGLIAGATIAGFVDAHAVGVSVASLVASKALGPGDAIVPILAVMTSNALSKIAMACGLGPRAFARGVVPAIVASMAAAWLVACLMPSR